MDLLTHSQLHSHKEPAHTNLDSKSVMSILYHDLFGYALNQNDLIKWQTGEKVLSQPSQIGINFKNGYYFTDNNTGATFKRALRQRLSAKKLEIAKRAVNILKNIPSIKMVGVTGSLAMQNATDESDIDLIIVTSKNSLWTSRLIGYALLKLSGFKIRKAGDKNEKDKLCLNMWMDESELEIKNQNIYTAHEIAQIMPLVNKNKTYEKLIGQNLWIKDFWPNAVNSKLNYEDKISKNNSINNLLNKFAFNIQYQIMKKKITKEVVTPTRAFFHPFDWGEEVNLRLSSS